jgi:predicted nucleic acid-binding Zn ribbon protein
MRDDEEDEAWDPEDEGDDAGDTVPCPYCGAAIYDDAVRCPKCGEYLSDEERTTAGRPTWVIVTALLVLAGFLWACVR